MPTVRGPTTPPHLLLTALLVLGLALAAPGTASAHPLLLATEPVADSTVMTTPQAVALTFAARPAGGEVTVTGPDGASVGAGPVVLDGAVMAAPVALTAAGRHAVTWSAVSGDGHRQRGAFVFYHAPAPSPSPLRPTGSTPVPTAGGPTGTGTASTPDDGGAPARALAVLVAAGLTTVLAAGLLARRGRR
ncbi:copper resistance CopC family protein [Geodermatophilus sp. SYSU D01036]